MKIIYSGLESSGKSYKLAMLVVDIAHRNAKWKESTGKVRTIASNLKFSEGFHNYCTQQLRIPIVYWENLEELIAMSDCDIIIDEVGNYFDSRLWSDLSLDVRRWLTQGAKVGIEIYGSAQDFSQVDKSFRRLVNKLFHITKLIGSPRPSATRPPVNKIWGVCSIRELNPREYNEDKKSFDKTQVMPGFFILERKFCEIFDTTQKIARSSPPALKHEERFCERDSCSFRKLIHV